MQDAYLDNLIAPEHINQATNYIENVYAQITDTFHKQRLIDLHTYQLVCMDNQSDSDDIFGIKYTQYKALFNDAIKLALESSKTSVGLSILSVNLERA